MEPSIKKEQIEVVMHIDEGVERDIKHLASQMHDVRDKESTSLESNKKELCDELVDLGFKQDIKGLSRCLDKFEELNHKLKEVLKRENNRTEINNKIERGELTTIKVDIKENEKANKIIKGLVELLPDEEFQDLAIEIFKPMIEVQKKIS